MPQLGFAAILAVFMLWAPVTNYIDARTEAVKSNCHITA